LLLLDARLEMPHMELSSVFQSLVLQSIASVLKSLVSCLGRKRLQIMLGNQDERSWDVRGHVGSVLLALVKTAAKIIYDFHHSLLHPEHS
jgi:hypothetical protein